VRSPRYYDGLYCCLRRHQVLPALVRPFPPSLVIWQSSVGKILLAATTAVKLLLLDSRWTIALVPGHDRPRYAQGFGGQRHGCLMDPSARNQRPNPLRSRIALLSQVPNDNQCSLDTERADIAVATLGNPPQTTLAPGAMLPGNQAYPQAPWPQVAPFAMQSETYGYLEKPISPKSWCFWINGLRCCTCRTLRLFEVPLCRRSDSSAGTSTNIASAFFVTTWAA